MLKNKYVVDRLEGNWVVLINQKTNEISSVLKGDFLPNTPKEGDRYELTNGGWRFLHDDTADQEEVKALFAALRK